MNRKVHDDIVDAPVSVKPRANVESRIVTARPLAGKENVVGPNPLDEIDTNDSDGELKVKVTIEMLNRQFVSVIAVQLEKTGAVETRVGFA